MFESEQQKVLLREAKRKAGRLVEEYRDAGGGIPWARWLDCFKDFDKDAQKYAINAAKDMGLLDSTVVWFVDMPKATGLDIKRMFTKLAAKLGAGINHSNDEWKKEQNARPVTQEEQVRARILQESLAARPDENTEFVMPAQEAQQEKLNVGNRFTLDPGQKDTRVYTVIRINPNGTVIATTQDGKSYQIPRSRLQGYSIVE